MKFTFRTKFVLANMIIVLLTMVLLAIFVIQGLLYYTFNNTQNQLLEMGTESQFYISQEIKSADISAGNISAYKENALSISEDLARINNTRVLLFDLDGLLVADSANLDTNEDIKNLEEIQIALGLDEGKSVSVYKRISGSSSIYYAMPVFIDSEKVGALFILQSLSYLDDIIGRMIFLFLGASFIGFMVVFIVSNVFSNSIFKPINQLVESTKNLSAGNFNELLEYNVDDEIGNLTTNFNKMSLHIKEKLNQIENEKQKLSSIIASIEDGVIAMDLDNRAFIINQAARIILDIHDEKAGMQSLLDKQDLAEMIDHVARERTDLSKEIDYDQKRLHVYCNMIRSGSNTIGILLVVRDITKLVELENQQRLFISSVSHELRTPLTTIIGYSDLLQRRGTENPELLQKSLQTINSEGQRLLRLVSDLLDMSKLENAQFSMKFSDIDLNILLEEVISQMKIKSNKYNIDILYNSTDLPLIKGDFDRLKQVMINVLDNAIKYSESGDIIKVLATTTENFVEISVRDFGPGIPPEIKDKIFDPFYRVDEDRSRNHGGSGLGLAIVKDIVQRHGGSVFVESQPDEGTMIQFNLPL
ncbi:sensor histidine kinase [Alkalibacter mobilis]|uniref:sensor histidine kinase n=1 Tax=Alkalibacter mobilis TaxID=2787712 RepID=UPI00189D5697|nr:ATP-binding protein [Alkalibacter mobilis]MBF7095915.1 HAMP domain-containing protein [Alkalibacter mobilis]